MTSASVVSAVGLPSQQPSSTKGVHLDVPCRAGRPPLAATSPSSPLHSPSSISPSQQYTSIRQLSSSPAAHASDGRFLRYTGKVSKCAPYISSRAERVGGHTFDQCRGLTYDKHGDTKVYNESDLQYDLDHGILSMQMLASRLSCLHVLESMSTRVGSLMLRCATSTSWPLQATMAASPHHTRIC